MRRLVVAAALLGLILASDASAAVRHLDVTDPQDAPPTVSGQPENSDLKRIGVDYDDALGKITMTLDYFNSTASLDPSSAPYAEYGDFSVGKVDPDLGNYCSSYNVPGGIDGRHDIFRYSNTNSASVNGYAGSLPLTWSANAERTHIVVTASSPTLRGRDYRCLTYSIRGAHTASAENPNSRYDEGCDCWYISYEEDAIADTAYFAGFAPAAKPPPAPKPPASKECSDGKDNDHDGWTDAQDRDCHHGSDEDGIWEEVYGHTACNDGVDNDLDGKKDEHDPGCSSGYDKSEGRIIKRASKVKIRLGHTCRSIGTDIWETSPDKIVKRNLPWGGRVYVAIRRGKIHKTKSFRPINDALGAAFYNLKPGRWRVAYWYSGDKYRKRSKTVHKTVRVSSGCE